MVSSTGIVDLFPLIRKCKLDAKGDESIIEQSINLFNRIVRQDEDIFTPFEGYGEVTSICHEIIRTLLSLGYWIPGKGTYQLTMIEEQNDDLPYLKNLLLNRGKYQFKMESV